MILLALHGAGGDETDFEHVGRVLAPTAVVVCPPVDDGLAEWLVKQPKKGHKLFAFGYSTGADFAVQLLLTRVGLLDGAVLLRPTAAVGAPEGLPELGGVPVLVVPGRSGSHKAAEVLARAGAAVDLAVQDADEDLIPQDFALAKRWLGQFL